MQERIGARSLVRRSPGSSIGGSVAQYEQHLATHPMDARARTSCDCARTRWSTTRDGRADIWRATRTALDGAWTNAAAVPELNSATLESNPTVTPDARRIVFSRGPNSSDRDLYEATRVGAGPWTGVTTIDELNTTDNDGGPMLALGGLLFVFFSDRPGAGGDALYIATRRSLDEPFGDAMPISELDTAADEEDPWLSEEASTLVFSRDGVLFITSRDRRG